MKFSEKYPNMQLIHEEHEGIIRGKEFKPCFTCKEHTQYIDIAYEAPFCSEECVKKSEDLINWEKEEKLVQEELNQLDKDFLKFNLTLANSEIKKAKKIIDKLKLELEINRGQSIQHNWPIEAQLCFDKMLQIIRNFHDSYID